MVKNSPASEGDTRDMSPVPGSRRSPGEGNGSPLQYSCLGNAMARGDWWAPVHRITKNRTQLSIYRLDTLALNSPENFFLISKVYILSFDLWSSNCVEREVQLF